MKHNEFKAFFKKQLENTLTYQCVSIDETLSSRNIYLLDEKLCTKYLIKCWFGTNEFTLSAFKINKNTKTVHAYNDYFLQEKGTYLESGKMFDFLSGLQEADNEAK